MNESSPINDLPLNKIPKEIEKTFGMYQNAMEDPKYYREVVKPRISNPVVFVEQHTSDLNALKRRWTEWKSYHSNKENLVKSTEEKLKKCDTFLKLMADIVLERTTTTILIHVSTPDLQNTSKKSGELLYPEVSAVSTQSYEPSRFNHAITVLFSKIWFDVDIFKKSYFDVQSLSNLVSVNRSTVHEGTQMLQTGYPCVLRLLLNRPDTDYRPDQMLHLGGRWRRLLTYAILRGNVNIVRELIRANTEVNILERFDNIPELFKGIFYLTPFLLAVSKGHIEIAQMLQRAGADIMRENDVHIGSALSIAFKMLWQKDGFGSIVEALLQMPGFKANGAGSVKTKALVNAIEIAGGRRVKKEYADALRLLIQSGADLRTAEYLGYTTLMRAVINGNLDIVHILLEALKSIRSSSSPNPQLVREFLEVRHPQNNKTALEIAETLWERTIGLDLPQGENHHERIYEILLEVHIKVGAQVL